MLFLLAEKTNLHQGSSLQLVSQFPFYPLLFWKDRNSSLLMKNSALTNNKAKYQTNSINYEEEGLTGR